MKNVRLALICEIVLLFVILMTSDFGFFLGVAYDNNCEDIAERMSEMDPHFNKITKAGYQKIQKEIDQLENSRPTKIKILSDARALGDLSENAEYSAAKRDLRHLESRLRFLRKELQYAKIYTPSDNDRVEVGKYVTFEFLDEHATETYQIVGTPEVDIDHGKISIASPIGAALLNHRTGDTVKVVAPNLTYQVKITAVKIDQ